MKLIILVFGLMFSMLSYAEDECDKRITSKLLEMKAYYDGRLAHYKNQDDNGSSSVVDERNRDLDERLADHQKELKDGIKLLDEARRTARERDKGKVWRLGSEEGRVKRREEMLRLAREMCAKEGIYCNADEVYGVK